MKSSVIRLYRSEIKATVLLSYPIVIAQVGTIMMGVFANMMVGHLGPAPIASVGLANSISNLISVLGMGTLAMLAPQVAIGRGQNDTVECRRLLKASLWLGLIAGSILAVVLLGVASVFEIFRQTPEVTALSKGYLSITGISVIPMMLFMALKYFSDGLSHTRVAMFITLAGLAADVCFNWVLIYGHFGFPALGVNGAATGILLTRTCMAIAIFLYLRTSPVFTTYWQPVQESIRPVIARIVRLGLPGGFQYFFEVGAFAGSAVMAGWLGTVSLAAHEIALNLAAVSYMIAAGNAAAGSIRVGEAVGAGSRTAIIRAGTTALIIGIAFMSFTCLLFLTLNRELAELYIKNSQVVDVAGALLIIAGFFQLSDGIQVAGLGILRGISDVNVPTVVTLVAYWVIGIPVGYVLAFPLHLGIQGIWVGLLIGLTISALLLTIRFYRLSRYWQRSQVQPSV